MDNAYTGQPGQMAEGEPEGQADGSEICIAIAQDGAITTYLEVGGQPKGEKMPARDITEALKQAVSLYRQIGAGSEQDAFSAGFGKAGPSPSPASPSERLM